MMTTEEPTLTRRERREIEEAEQTVAATPEPTSDKTEPAVEATQCKKPDLMLPTPTAIDMGKDTGALPVLDLDDLDDYSPSRPAYIEASELTSQELADLLEEQEREAEVIQAALDREQERRAELARSATPNDDSKPVEASKPSAGWKIFTTVSFVLSGLSAAGLVLTTLGVL